MKTETFLSIKPYRVGKIWAQSIVRHPPKFAKAPCDRPNRRGKIIFCAG
jgi:hypothetical protein